MISKLCTLLLLAMCFSQTLGQAVAPVSGTATQQNNALTSLRNILATKPDASKNDDQFKAALIQWVQTTEAATLRALLPRLQLSTPRCAPSVKTSRPFYKINRRGKQPPTYEDSIPPQLILKKLEAMANETSGEQLKVFLAAMSTADGKKTLKKLNVKETVIDELIKQMNGDVEQQTKAKNTFKTLLQSITKKELPALRPVYKVYLQYSLRQKTTQTVNKATPEQLIALIEVLSKAEKRYSFRGVKFSNLLTQAKDDKNRQTAVNTFNKWISTADIKNLRRVVHYITVNERPVKTLEEIKALVSKNIESKSSAQLIEFLEVLETAEGKVLLGKLSAKPSTPPQDLIKQLKSGVKADETSVKKVLQDWINKLTVNDTKEFEKSGQLFLQYRARKAAVEAIQKADQTTLLKILSFLTKKESEGVKFDGIKFTDLKNKLEKDGSKALEETKKAMIDWVTKIKFEQLVALQNAHPDTPRPVSSANKNKAGVVAFKAAVVSQNVPANYQHKPAGYLLKPASNPNKPLVNVPKPPTKQTDESTTTQRPTTTTTKIASTTTTKKASTTTTKKAAPQKKTKLAAQPKPTNQGVQKSAPVTTITSLADIKTAVLFQQFMLKQSKVPVSQVNVRKALVQVCTSGSNEDIDAIFTTAHKGLTGHVAKLLNEGLFKVQITRTHERIKKISKPADWTSLRTDLQNWIGKWKASHINLFSIWYKRGAEGKK